MYVSPGIFQWFIFDGFYNLHCSSVCSASYILKWWYGGKGRYVFNGDVPFFYPALNSGI